LALNQIARNLLSVLVIVIMAMSSGISQAPARLLGIPAETAQKLQNLLDEDALACCHRAYLHQEQKHLSDRPLPDERLPGLHSGSISANFNLTVLSLHSSEKHSKQSRAPPLSAA
jgi:hypothetical protein